MPNKALVLKLFLLKKILVSAMNNAQVPLFKRQTRSKLNLNHGFFLKKWQVDHGF